MHVWGGSSYISCTPFDVDLLDVRRMLYDFCQRQGERKVSATYLVVGKRGTEGSGAVEVRPKSRSLSPLQYDKRVLTASLSWYLTVYPLSRVTDAFRR